MSLLLYTYMLKINSLLFFPILSITLVYRLRLKMRAANGSSRALAFLGTHFQSLDLSTAPDLLWTAQAALIRGYASHPRGELLRVLQPALAGTPMCAASLEVQQFRHDASLELY